MRQKIPQGAIATRKMPRNTPLVLNRSRQLWLERGSRTRRRAECPQLPKAHCSESSIRELQKLPREAIERQFSCSSRKREYVAAVMECHEQHIRARGVCISHKSCVRSNQKSADQCNIGFGELFRISKMRYSEEDAASTESITPA